MTESAETETVERLAIQLQRLYGDRKWSWEALSKRARLKWRAEAGVLLTLLGEDALPEVPQK